MVSSMNGMEEQIKHIRFYLRNADNEQREAFNKLVDLYYQCKQYTWCQI